MSASRQDDSEKALLANADHGVTSERGRRDHRGGNEDSYIRLGKTRISPLRRLLLGMLLLGTLLWAGVTLGLPHMDGGRAERYNNHGKTESHLDPFPNRPRLQFNQGKFKIVVFSDLHYGERDANNTWVQWGVDQDTKSTQVMAKALDDEHPDFVVFNGDQITGENQLWENATAHLDNIFGPVHERRVPFATVYGNHDESYNISHRSSFEYETQQAAARDLSWTQAVPESSNDPKGVFNYYIPVYRNSHAPAPALLLWFFDSRAGTFNSQQFGVKDEPWMSQDWVDPQTAVWINNTAKAMRGAWGELPKSLVYVHIPPIAAGTIAKSVAADPEGHPGIDFDEPIDTQGGRSKFWGHSNPDTPFWTAVTATLGGDGGQGLLAVVSGHDHGNDWCARSPEIGPYSFCFARHTGYGGYGGWARGSRVFSAEITHDGLNVRTWVRMEDHSTANTTTLAVDGKTVLFNSRDPAPGN